MSPYPAMPLTATTTYSSVDDSFAVVNQLMPAEKHNTYDVIGVERGSSCVTLQVTSDSDRPTYDELQIPKVKPVSRQNDENVDTNDTKSSAVYTDGASATTEPDIQHEVIDGCEYAVVQK